jgi:hypothetical protein
MLGHPTGAEVAAIAMMTAKKKLTNHGVLAGKKPGAPRVPYTIVERGGVPANFR